MPCLIGVDFIAEELQECLKLNINTSLTRTSTESPSSTSWKLSRCSTATRFETSATNSWTWSTPRSYTKLLLNMTNARFVSSAMLAHLVKLHRRVQEVKGKIRLCCLRPVIMDAFKVSNFDKIFEIFPDEAAALKKF